MGVQDRAFKLYIGGNTVKLWITKLNCKKPVKKT